MVRRLISTVVLVACAGFYALSAAEQTTVILTNGERRSGQLVSFADGQLKVGDQSIPLDQVAVIDFTGGTPSDLELSRVAPEGKGQTAIMRTGHAAGGRFLSFVGDHTLQWENGNGTQSQFPLRDVSRIYLNTNSARSVFNAEKTGRAPVAFGTSGQVSGTTITVPANQAWTDTGITVNQGDRVVFQASGEINYGAQPGAERDGGRRRGPSRDLPGSHRAGRSAARQDRQQQAVRHRQPAACADHAGIGPPDARRQRQRDR